eukprot:CFRG6474T1
MNEEHLNVLLLGEGNFSFADALIGATQSEPIISEFDKDFQALSVDCGDSKKSSLESSHCNGKFEEAKKKRLVNKKTKEYLKTTNEKLVRNASFTVSSYDSKAEVQRLYPESVPILQRLDSTNATVMHGVDALRLSSVFPIKKFDRIIWNHPHLGVENFRAHQALLAHFFASAKYCLKEGGMVYISLVSGQEERWEANAQADRIGFTHLSSTPFLADDFPGYEVRRNKTGASFKATPTQLRLNQSMISHTHVYQQRENNELTDSKADQIYKIADKEKKKGKTINTDDLNQEGFTCKECGKVIPTARGLQSHTKFVHTQQLYGSDWSPNKVAEFQCDHCDKYFAFKKDREQHVLAKHSPIILRPENSLSVVTNSSCATSDAETRTCAICNHKFPKDWDDEMHLNNLSPISALELTCGECGKVFSEERARQQHIRRCLAPVNFS